MQHPARYQDGFTFSGFQDATKCKIVSFSVAVLRCDTAPSRHTESGVR